MNDSLRAVRAWLLVVCLMILGTVAVGGITRLTESGLSMVKWEPILGTVPPLNEAQWQERFDQYRAYPEFKLLRPDMTLPQFKWIFFWEYLHRLIGRAIGIVFLLPYLYFLARGRVRGRLAWKLGLAFLLGGLQGAMGWYMVRSGLVDVPTVSHYRLAAHLSLALVLLGYLYWIWMDLLPGDPEPAAPRALQRATLAFGLALVVQIVWGAFVAGLNAGFIYNTFPTMQGFWIPPEWLHLRPAWLNLVQNPVTVQWVHRWLGVGMGVAALALAWQAYRSELTPRQRLNQWMLFGVTLLQVGLGIAALLTSVPVWLGTWHQVNAALMLLAVLAALHAQAAPPARRG